MGVIYEPIVFTVLAYSHREVRYGSVVQASSLILANRYVGRTHDTYNDPMQKLLFVSIGAAA